MFNGTFIVGVSGRKEHGKTTLAHYLHKEVSRLGYSAVVVGLSDPMYQIAVVITGDSDFSKHKTYELVPGVKLTGTEILQKIGSECFRDVFGQAVWNQRLRVSIEKVHSNPAFAFVSDYRMPDIEGEIFDYRIYLNASGVDTTQNIHHRTEHNHEILQAQADVVVQRDGSLYAPSIADIATKIVWARNEAIPS